MSAIDNQQNSGDRLIRCQVTGESYGLEMAWVRSIERTEEIVYETGGNGRIGWFPSTQGKIPVFSLAERLQHESGQPATLNTPQRLILLDDPSGVWGLLVDDVAPLSPAFQRLPIPDLARDPARNYFSEVLDLGSEMLLLLSPPQLNPNAPVVEAAKTVPAPLRERVMAPFATNGFKPQASNDSQQTNVQQLIAFTIPGLQANTAVGLSVTQVEEIMEYLPILPVPAVQDFVLGLVNWRTQAVPVVDLRVLQESPRLPTYSAGDDARLLIVRTVRQGSGGGVLIGVLVEPNMRLLRMPLEYAACHVPASLNQDLIHAAVKLDDALLVFPNLEAILSCV